MKKTGPVAIIGAGISGLSCAQALRAAGVEVRIYESGPGVGGRCATRLWQGHLIDYGAQFLTAQSTEFKRELLSLRLFRPIISPIVDSTGGIVASPAGPRFYVLQGNNYLAQVLSRGLDVRLNTRVETVSFLASGVNCLGETFRAVVSALPAPLTSRLFGLAQTTVDYDPCIVALLEYTGANLGLSRESYARIRAGSGNHVMASYCENHKVGRIVGAKTVFIAQASPAFSREYEGVPPETYLPNLARENDQFWRIPAGLLTASSGHRWAFGQPRNGRPRAFDLPPGAFHCGDSRTEPTLEAVWLDGRRAADDVLKYLGTASG